MQIAFNSIYNRKFLSINIKINFNWMCGSLHRLRYVLVIILGTDILLNYAYIILASKIILHFFHFNFFFLAGWYLCKNKNSFEKNVGNS